MSLNLATSEQILRLSDLQSPPSDQCLSSSSILQISIDLGDGREEILHINELENPEIQTIEFCQKHKLGPAIKLAICDEIDRVLSTADHLSFPTAHSAITISPKKPKQSNIGERLYIKGVKMKQRLEVKNDLVRKSFLAKEMKDLTFKPETNSPERRKINLEELLIFKGKQKNEKIVKRKSEKKIEIMSKCTFSPFINNKSIESCRNPSQRFDTLYKDAENFKEKQRKKNLEIMAKECPFEPDLTLTKKQTEKIIQNSPKSQKSVKASSSSCSPQVIPIKKLALSTEKTTKILQKLKKTRFLYLFENLLPDSMGYISKETIYKSTLPADILKVLKPLLTELEDLDEVLNLNEFSESMEILLKSLPPSDKSLILNTGKAKTPLEKFDFTPKINKTRIFSSPFRLRLKS